VPIPPQIQIQTQVATPIATQTPTATRKTPAMPRKRQRTDGKDDGEEGPGPSVTKRKRKILNYDPHEIIHELYETIRNHKTEDGRMLCESFIRVPKRRSTADYYDVVTTPIDMLKIQQKVKTDNYDYVDQLSADILLMVNNAKAYYKKTSQEYKDACDLMELYERTRADLVEAVFASGERTVSRKTPLIKDVPDLPDVDDEESDEDDDEDDDEDGGSSKYCDDDDDLEQLFAAIVTTKDGDRDISQAFQLLPLKIKYPQYYEVIKKPIDLKMIATKIQEAKYSSLDELEQDLLQMVKNAKTFNEPKSLIYKDAVTLQKIIAERKREIEFKKSGKSGRLRAKGRSIIQKMSAVCAALKYQSSEDDAASSSHFDMDSEAEGVGNDLVEDDPQWILYNHVKNIEDDDGDLLSEPFLKQPSKKYFPEYYKEIKKPMSFNKIRYKIEMNSYDTVMDLAQDFVLMFKNAKKYNHDESQIYKDAVTLQVSMIEKLRELDEDLADEFMEEMEDDDGEDDDDDDDEEDEDDGYEEEEEPPKTPAVSRSRARKSIVTPESNDRKRPAPRKSLGDETLKKRLRSLFTTVYDYSDTNGRLLRPIFMVLPSRKDYPDYYQVIMEPIDIPMIQEKIRAEKYPTEHALLSDFELMFNNARHYNEEGSQVYQDANTLDKALHSKWKYMQSQARLPGARGKFKVTEASPLAQKLNDLYESVRDFQDRSGRALSAPFIKLPNKTDYPDYYEVIKRPMDMQTIQQKMVMSKYDSVEEMVNDFVLMFDNACKYNEPESVIYRDALALQRVCFQKKLELMSSCLNEVPDVKALIQDLMKNLFISSFNHMDDEGRCYSDSFGELIEKDKGLQASGEVIERPLTFDQIRKNLDKGRYRRIDCFQDDMFKVFERAREFSRLDSQLYEDAVEMQKYFIKTRDELCKNGELLLTPALSYTEKHLSFALDLEQKEKSKAEKEQMKEEDEEKIKKEGDETSGDKMNSNNGEEDFEYKGLVYSRGDFVYIAARNSMEPHIMTINTFGKDESGNDFIKGKWFYRPGETYHLATRKFLEKEVFLSDNNQGTSMSEIVGRCCVMHVKDYFKCKPEGFPDKDVYVCESRYISKSRCFKKIKTWKAPQSKSLKYVTRDVPLVPMRVASMFADKLPNENVLDESETVIDKKYESVVSVVETDDGNVYYDQHLSANGCFKLGDGVFIRNSEGQPTIARIDKIWTDKIGENFFHYTPFLRPSEVEHAPNRLFYKQEVFQAALEDCALIKNIVGKCCVLHIKEYCSSRPTEIPEQDIFINECKYQEADKTVKKQSKLKKYTLSPKVVDDEIYFFRKQIALEKEPSPLLMKVQEDALFNDTEDSQPEPDASNDGISIAASPSSQTPTQTSKKKRKETPLSRRLPSGYIVFAGENRKMILSESPSLPFGEISKIVGNRWRNLSKHEREIYEDRAKRMSEDMMAKAKQQEANEKAIESGRSQSPWSDHGGNPSTPVHHSSIGSQAGLGQFQDERPLIDFHPKTNENEEKISGEDACRRCNYRVYDAEKLMAAGRVWHRRCFCCVKCKRHLDSTTVNDGTDGEIYCRSCHSGKFGLKGYGFGQGAGTLLSDGHGVANTYASENAFVLP